MLFIRSCCLLHVHAPLTHMHLGARTARSAVKLENAHTLSAALPMYACLLVATLHLRARGQARANVCQQTKCSAFFVALQTLPHPQLRLGSQSPSSEASLAKVKGNTLGAGRCERRG